MLGCFLDFDGLVMAEEFTELDIAENLSERISYYTRTVLADDEILNRIQAADNDPRLHFELLDCAKEQATTKALKATLRKIKAGATNPQTLLAEASLHLESFDVEQAKERIERLRRNQFADTGIPTSNNHTNAAAYIAAGIVAVIGAKVINDIVSDKFSDGSFDPDGPSLGPDDGPIWPRRGENPVIPRRPSQPGWTDPPRPNLDERLAIVVEPRLRSVVLDRL